jgi:hypothetical protein
MRTRQWTVLSLLAVSSWLALQVAAPLPAQQASDAVSPAKESSTEKELNVRYAKTYLRLMEATLSKYQETNRRQPNVIRRGVIQAIEENVRDARERVQLAESDEARHAEIYISSAQADLRAVQESLRKAEVANSQRSGTVSQVEIARLKAEIELATVRLEKARHLASESSLSNVEFELEQLREDVQSLRLIVALLRDRN